MKNKLNQILEWIDLPLDERPQLIMSKSPSYFLIFFLLIAFYSAYEPSLDQAGHATGPYSSLVNVCPKKESRLLALDPISGNSPSSG